eukprot:2511142-Alexandrium_andersonii.AAC.1
MVKPVRRGWAGTTRAGPGPFSGAAHVASAMAAAVAGLGSAIPAGTRAWRALPALPWRAHRTAA